jgi:hypothetical protein
MRLVKQTRWQKFKHWLASLVKGPQGIQSSAKGPTLSVHKGGKVDLNFDAKSTVYNPREFRADKGPRK